VDISPLFSAGEIPRSGPALASQGAGEKKLADAARQFEALLLAEMLRVSRGGGSGWLGAGEGEDSMSCAMEMAQEYLAQALADQGGIGLVPYVKEHLASR
jgi:Rod binding domain-containing protein